MPSKAQSELFWLIGPALVPPRSAGQIDRENRHTKEQSSMAVSSSSDSWIGASVLRKEDARHLLGHGTFIADLRIPGVHDVAFVRSDMAHANVRRIIRPPGTAGHVFTLADIGPLNILEAGPELAAHRHSPYPALADETVRYVGQPIVACMQPTRAQAEDLADLVEL